MTPLTPETVTALAQTAATSPAHLDPQVVQQVCQEWQISQQAAALRRCIVESAYQDKVKAESALAVARAALQEVEFKIDSWGDDACPWCESINPNHAPDCQRQAALGLGGG